MLAVVPTFGQSLNLRDFTPQVLLSVISRLSVVQGLFGINHATHNLAIPAHAWVSGLELNIETTRTYILDLLRIARGWVLGSMSSLVDIVVYDLPQYIRRFSCIYVVSKPQYGERLYLRTAVSVLESLQSVVGYFFNAEWLERELAEMFGLFVTGNPNSTKLVGDYRGFDASQRKGSGSTFANNSLLDYIHQRTCLAFIGAPVVVDGTFFGLDIRFVMEAAVEFSCLYLLLIAYYMPRILTWKPINYNDRSAKVLVPEPIYYVAINQSRLACLTFIWLLLSCYSTLFETIVAPFSDTFAALLFMVYLMGFNVHRSYARYYQKIWSVEEYITKQYERCESMFYVYIYGFSLFFVFYGASLFDNSIVPFFDILYPYGRDGLPFSSSLADAGMTEELIWNFAVFGSILYAIYWIYTDRSRPVGGLVNSPILDIKESEYFQRHFLINLGRCWFLFWGYQWLAFFMGFEFCRLGSQGAEIWAVISLCVLILNFSCTWLQVPKRDAATIVYKFHHITKWVFILLFGFVLTNAWSMSTYYFLIDGYFPLLLATVIAACWTVARLLRPGYSRLVTRSLTQSEENTTTLGLLCSLGYPRNLVVRKMLPHCFSICGTWFFFQYTLDTPLDDSWFLISGGLLFLCTFGFVVSVYFLKSQPVDYLLAIILLVWCLLVYILFFPLVCLFIRKILPTVYVLHFLVNVLLLGAALYFVWWGFVVADTPLSGWLRVGSWSTFGDNTSAWLRLLFIYFFRGVVAWVCVRFAFFSSDTAEFFTSLSVSGFLFKSAYLLMIVPITVIVSSPGFIRDSSTMPVNYVKYGHRLACILTILQFFLDLLAPVTPIFHKYHIIYFDGVWGVVSNWFVTFALFLSIYWLYVFFRGAVPGVRILRLLLAFILLSLLKALIFPKVSLYVFASQFLGILYNFVFWLANLKGLLYCLAFVAGFVIFFRGILVPFLGTYNLLSDYTSCGGFVLGILLVFYTQTPHIDLVSLFSRVSTDFGVFTTNPEPFPAGPPLSTVVWEGLVVPDAWWVVLFSGLLFCLNLIPGHVVSAFSCNGSPYTRRTLTKRLFGTLESTVHGLFIVGWMHLLLWGTVLGDFLLVGSYASLFNLLIVGVFYLNFVYARRVTGISLPVFRGLLKSLPFLFILWRVYMYALGFDSSQLVNLCWGSTPILASLCFTVIVLFATLLFRFVSVLTRRVVDLSTQKKRVIFTPDDVILSVLETLQPNHFFISGFPVFILFILFIYPTQAAFFIFSAKLELPFIASLGVWNTLYAGAFDSVFSFNFIIEEPLVNFTALVVGVFLGIVYRKKWFVYHATTLSSLHPDTSKTVVLVLDWLNFIFIFFGGYLLMWLVLGPLYFLAIPQLNMLLYLG